MHKSFFFFFSLKKDIRKFKERKGKEVTTIILGCILVYMYFNKSFLKQTQTVINYLPCQNIATILVTPLIRSSHFLSRPFSYETGLKVTARRMYYIHGI